MQIAYEVAEVVFLRREVAALQERSAKLAANRDGLVWAGACGGVALTSVVWAIALTVLAGVQAAGIRRDVDAEIIARQLAVQRVQAACDTQNYVLGRRLNEVEYRTRGR